MDRQSVFSTRLYPAETEDSNTHIRGLLESFILDFRLDNIFIYRSAFSNSAQLQALGREAD